ncbi:MAG: cupin domain-containing protein [Aquificae bacterium]|nr:cupin domain-containing protein [Aquificota bacterium]
MRLFSPFRLEDIAGIIEEKKDKVKEIEALKLNETPNLTQLLVFIKTSEVPHYHAEHDLTFTILEGEGELYLEGRKEKLKKGDWAFIPARAVHYYRNTAEISVLLAVFSPSYDGKDSVRVDADES